MAASFAISTTSRRAFDRLAGDVQRVMRERFVALIASGPASSVAFVSRLDAGDLTALGAMAELWHRDGLDTPLFLTPDEFRRSLDAFPVEYQAMIDRHVVVAGRDPFAGIAVGHDDLRRACEVQAKSHLIHLRQGWVDAHGDPEGLASLIVRSVAPLRAMLANVARLHNLPAGEPGAIAAAALAGISGELVDLLLRSEDDPELGDELVSRLPEYLAAAEGLWTWVDTWRRG